MVNAKIKICPNNNEVVSCEYDCIMCHKFKSKIVDTYIQKREISSNELIFFIKNILKIKLSLWQIKLIKEFCKNK